jgi:hypothetical protein
MKKIILLSLLVTASSALPAPAAEASAAPRPSVPLVSRIDALLRPHLKPTPLPVSLPNPFIVVRGSAELSETPGPKAVPEPGVSAAPAVEDALLTDGEILARCMAQLKIGGTMQLNDVTQLMINRNTYKEGDYLTLEGRSAPIHVQIVRLSREELTLRYNEVTQTVRLKAPAKP